MKQHFVGLIAAPFTPLKPDRSLDLDTVEVLAASLSANGVRGAFVCGTTGESTSLTVDERMRVAERWQAAAGKDLAVIVHAGHLCLDDAKAIARHASRIGADAIAGSAPFYLKPRSVEELVAFLAELAAAAPDLPFYYYHIPALTGVDFPMVEFLRAGMKRMPNLAGLKFTHEDLLDFHRCVDFEDGRFDVLFGRDEILLAALALGARGAVGSTYNFAAPLYQHVIEAFRSGDLAAARAHQARARDLVVVLRRFGGLPAGKTIMNVIGLDCGPVRLPLIDLTDAQREALRADLDRIGFFQYCSRSR